MKEYLLFFAIGWVLGLIIAFTVAEIFHLHGGTAFITGAIIGGLSPNISVLIRLTTKKVQGR